MKNLQQTEKHLADKLQNVPVPDVDQGWEQMRKLLDHEMPEPVAGAWSGNRKWWWMGITAGVIMLATWLTQQLNDDAALAEKQGGTNMGVVRNGNNADKNNNGNTKTNEANINADAGNASVTTNNSNKVLDDVNSNEYNTSAGSDNSSTDISKNSLPVNSPDKISTGKTVDAGTTKTVSSNNTNNPDANANSAAVKRAIANKQDARTSPTVLSKQQDQDNDLRNQRSGAFTPDKTKIASGDKPASEVADKDVALSRSVTSKNVTGNKEVTSNKDVTGNKHVARNKDLPKKDIARNQSLITNASGSDKNTINRTSTDNRASTDPTVENAISNSRNANEVAPSVSNIAIDTETGVSGPATQFNEINTFQPEQVAVSGKTDRVFTREMRKKSMKADNRRVSRSSMRGNSRDSEKELTFAAGLALPQSFAVGSQQSSSYNVNGGSGRITDYLPAPFFQYHINNKLFVQTEFHFQSPQYTQRFLLSRSIDSFASRVYENNVRLEKLYYFNIPFNVYYSPARNFYIGGGVQYSSLLSGVASYENRTTEGQTVLNHAAVARRFNYDSVASVFTPSEWRYQFDANYYFNRFTLGLRFNRAMTNFIDMSGGGYVPPARDRNKSFLLYLRFNIWEERKK